MRFVFLQKFHIFIANIFFSVGLFNKSNARIKTTLKAVLNFAYRRILSIFVIFKLFHKNSKFTTFVVWPDVS